MYKHDESEITQRSAQTRYECDVKSLEQFFILLVSSIILSTIVAFWVVS